MNDRQIPTDLHGHSAFSDGRATPEEFVASRRERGLQMIALSDHDVLCGVRRAATSAEAAGLLLVPAMETTAFVGFGTSAAEQFHVLAYFPPRMLADGDLWRTFLFRRGQLVQGRWRSFALDWAFGLKVPDQAALGAAELSELPAEEFPGLLLLLDRIRARCHALFQPFIRHHVRFWSEDRELFGWSPEELIDAIRADGGIDVVAHPARYRDKERLARVLLGASGVEAYTSRHRPEWAARFRAFAETHDKLWTASMDDHQSAAYERPPSGTPVWVAERLLGHSLPPDLLAEPGRTAA